MKRALLLATLIAGLALAGNAGAHPMPSGFNPGLSTNWFDLDDQKIADLRAAARAPKPTGETRAARCRNGMAGEFPCDNVHLLGRLTLAEIGAKNETEIGNDSWGWVDPQTGRAADGPGLIGWTSLLRQGGPEEEVAAGLLSSDEYFARLQ